MASPTPVSIHLAGRTVSRRCARVRVDGVVTPVYVGSEVGEDLATPPIEFDTPLPWSEARMHQSDTEWWFEPLPYIGTMVGLAWDSVAVCHERYSEDAGPAGASASPAVVTALQRLGSELRACCADVFSLLFQEADSPAFMVARKAIEAWVHSRLLVHFGEPVAALWLDDDQNTARERTRATAIDKALAGLGLTDSRTRLRPLVRAARKRIDPDRRTWRAGSYWWLENTTAGCVSSFREAFEWIIANDPGVASSSLLTNGQYVSLFQVAVQILHMHVHPHPLALRDQTARQSRYGQALLSARDQRNFVLLAILYLSLTYRDLTVEYLGHEGPHALYIEALHDGLISERLF